MTDTNDGPEPLFRSNKRRKVFRKRPEHDDTDQEATSDSHATKDAAPANASRGPDDNDVVTHSVPRFQRPGTAARKNGIAFSSNPTRAHEDEQEQAEEMALVPSNDSTISEAVQTARFTKPTGRATVAEDKNMTAYVEAKMAAMRPSAKAAMSGAFDGKDETSAPLAEQAAHSGFARREDIPVSASPTARQESRGDSRDRTERTQSNRRRQTRARNQPNPDSQARSTMIDEFLASNPDSIPLYAAPQPHRSTANHSAAGEDNDTAAAEAFKAQLLADLQSQSLRRRPPQPRQHESRPKLGGSRAQRERMRVAAAKAEEETGKGNGAIGRR